MDRDGSPAEARRNTRGHATAANKGNFIKRFKKGAKTLKFLKSAVICSNMDAQKKKMRSTAT